MIVAEIQKPQEVPAAFVFSYFILNGIFYSTHAPPQLVLPHGQG